MASTQKHNRRRQRILPAMAWTLSSILLCCFLQVQALPQGFVSERIVNPSDEAATTGVFAPNLREADHPPMMLLSSKRSGRIRVLENLESSNDETNSNNLQDGAEDGRLILDLSQNMCNNGQRGLFSMAIHPNFLETRWVYLYYTQWREGCLEDAIMGPQNVLVRFTMNPTSLALEDEEVLMEFGSLATQVRNGGAMAFGTDGLLYLATGDAGMPQSAQNRQNLLGALLRVKDDGRAPEDNPYAETGFPCGKANGRVPNEFAFPQREVYCNEIYSWGLRNPVKLALNMQQSGADKALFSISDVGGETFEELSWAGTDFKAKNYGWPVREGPCATSTQLPNCNPPLAGSTFVDPFHYYTHNRVGRVGGSTFVPVKTWPKEYNFLFLDMEFEKIYNLVEDSSAECRESCYPPTSGFVNTTFYEPTLEEWLTEERVVDIFFGPYENTQALYVIQNGVESNSILRIRYEGSEPVAIIEIRNDEDPASQKQIISVGEKVLFDGEKSFDLDGEDLVFQWNFGDGSNSRTNSSTPSHVYETPGEYTVMLVVTTSRGQASLASTTIVVEDSLNPTVVMTSPNEGDVFAAGKKLRLKAEAIDSEGKNIPGDQMTWSVRQYHSGGFDFLLDETSGNDFKLDPFLDPEDPMSKDTLFLRVVLFVTDDNGLMTKVERDIYPDSGADVYPDTVTVNLVTQPEGLKISLGDNEFTAPTQIESLANLPVQVVPEQYPYRFQQWSDGSTNPSRATLISSQEANSTGTTVAIEAIFCMVDDAPCKYATTSCCGGYCDESGFCSSENQQSETPDADQSTETTFLGSDVSIETTEQGEVPDGTDAPGDDETTNQEYDNKSVDEVSNGQENAHSHGVTASWKYFICLSMVAFLILCLLYFGAKYFRLKRELKKQKKKSLENEKSKRLNSEEVSSGEAGNSSTSGGESSSYDSFSSSSSSDFSSKLGGKTRAEHSFDEELALTTPRTPDTVQTIDSPSHLDPCASPSDILTTHIDETLVRLDDLLTKCFTRKPKSDRKLSQNDDWLEEYAEDSNSDVTELYENNDLAPIWLSSNKESTPGSPLRENSNASCMETMFPVSSLYSAGPFQEESEAVHLQDETLTSTTRDVQSSLCCALATSEDILDKTSERPWDEERITKSDENLAEESETIEKADDLPGDGGSVKSDSSNISNGRQLLINKADDLISAWADSDNNHEVV